MDNSCKNQDCKRSAFRVRTNERGEPVAVFQTRHDSKPHLQEFTADELEKMAKSLRESRSFAFAAK